ncbi:MAG: sensor histidine kinase, partial [Tepidisphaerales bacterium]
MTGGVRSEQASQLDVSAADAESPAQAVHRAPVAGPHDRGNGSSAGAAPASASAAATASATTAAGRPGWLDGRRLVVLLLTGTACTLLVCLLAAVLWMADLMAQRERETLQNKATVVARTLAISSAELLRADELTSLRRLLPELAEAHQLGEIALSMPDGQIVAHSEPSRITQVRLPDRWSATAVDDTAVVDPSVVVQTVPVPGRGPLILTVRPPTVQGRPLVSLLTVVAVVGSLAVAGLLLLYRRVARPMRTLGLIGSALADSQRCPDAISALRLDERHGPEAVAWNALLRRLEAEPSRAAAPATAGAAPATPESDNDLEQVMNILPTGVLVLDRAARVCQANNMAALLLGGTRETVFGQTLPELLPSPDVDAIARMLGEGRLPRRTIELKRAASGTEAVLRVTVRPLRRDDGGAALVLIDDVTQQRIADASRNLFIAQATHELRTPLTNMRLALEELTADDAPALPDEAAPHVNMLQTEVRRLERIVADMLAVAEIEAGSMKLTRGEIKLDRLLAELQQDHGPAAAKKNISFSVHLPPKLPTPVGDREKLAQALHNLVGNALKYTPAGGKVSLTVEETPDHTLRFIVADTGIGISREDQAKLFNRFSRGSDPRVAHITGTGLGLALSREIARLHGGDITVESELDKGSVFTLTL